MTESIKASKEYREQLYEVIREEIPFKQKAKRALELGVEYLGADNGYLTQINRETDHWEAVVSTDAQDGPVPAGLELDLGTTYCERTVDSGAQISLHDAENQGWSNELPYETYGLSCYLGTTLVVDGEEYGTVCFAAEDPREEPFSDSETMFAELVARLLERELERASHETAFRKQVNLSTVLNRVLRHNLRNDMIVIRGRTQLLADGSEENPHAEIALRNIDKLIQLGEKARELEQVIGETAEHTQANLQKLLTHEAKKIQRDYPAANISVDCDESVSLSVFDSFAHAIRELIDNAAKHSGETPTVEVTVDADDDEVTISIKDDGPGLSTQEQHVLNDGAESPLVHGSGLGLWLVNWVVTTHGGTVEATVTDNGTTMEVTVPRVSGLLESPSKQELARSLDQYKEAFEQANEAMIFTDADGRILDANPAAGDIPSLSKHELLGRNIAGFYPDDFDFEAEWEAFQTGEKSRDTITVIDANDEEHIVEYAGTQDVVPGQHLFVTRDITERVQQERELRRKTEAIDAGPIGVTITDPTQEDNPIIYANDMFCELSGYDRDEILGRNWRFMQDGLSQGETIEEIRKAIDAEKEVSTTVRNVKKDGTEFWNHITISPVKNKHGEVQNWIGFEKDVTERIERTQQLELAETVFQNTQDALFVIDVADDGEFYVERVNEIYEELTGLSNAEITGQTPTEIVGDEIGSIIESQYSKCVEQQKTIKYPEEIPVDGEQRQWETKVTPVMSDGNVDKLVGAMRDVTSDPKNK